MTPERHQQLKLALSKRQPDLTVLAESVNKPHNIGALLRTCDAVGVLTLHAVAPRGGFAKGRRVTAGTRDWVSTRQHEHLEGAVSELKSKSFQLVAAHFSDDALDYRELDYTRPTAFLLGAELAGVSPAAAALADHHVVIPMRGLVESLNVSVAGALLLYEAARQREAQGFYRGSRLPQAEFDRLLFEWCYPRIADRCRRHDLPYPVLDEDGQFSGNPFLGA
jgi:tRNA (guanosine-2'-O-)-methyltransferase